MVFQDLLTTKDDYLRASRALLREIIKQTKHEINFQAFCLGLMQERKESQYAEMEFKVPLSLTLVLLDDGGVLGSSICFSGSSFFCPLLFKSTLPYPSSKHLPLPFLMTFPEGSFGCCWSDSFLF